MDVRMPDGVIVRKGQPIFKVSPDEKVATESAEERDAKRREMTNEVLAWIPGGSH